MLQLYNSFRGRQLISPAPFNQSSPLTNHGSSLVFNPYAPSLSRELLNPTWTIFIWDVAALNQAIRVWQNQAKNSEHITCPIPDA